MQKEKTKWLEAEEERDHIQHNRTESRSKVHLLKIFPPYEVSMEMLCKKLLLLELSEESCDLKVVRTDRMRIRH